VYKNQFAVSCTTCIHNVGFVRVGGYAGLYHSYMSAIPNTTLLSPNETCGRPREDSWIMLRDPISSDMPWPGFLFGQTVASIWYWCADQASFTLTCLVRVLDP
jgi:hypothetical protein